MMKENCQALKISIWMLVVSFIVLVFFQLLNAIILCDIIEIIKDISLGIFSSSIVTIFFYTSAYRIEKRKLLENYWNEVRKILFNLNKIEYMSIDFDAHIIIGYIRERSDLI